MPPNLIKFIIMHHSSTFAEFRRGIIEATPILIGVMPFGLILGTRAAQQGMSWLEVVLMMGLNFAGGSEFAAVSLWQSPRGIYPVCSPFATEEAAACIILDD